MEALRAYLFSVVSAAIAVSILTSLFAGDTGTGKLVRLIGRLMLTVVVITPLVRIDPDQILRDTFRELDAAAYVQQGVSLADEQRRAVIKEQAQAYILDKAEALSAELSAEVELSSSGTPARVILRGTVAPAAKLRLQHILTQDLGISKENQVWIGENSG